MKQGSQRIISRPYYTVRHAPATSFDFQPHSHSAITVTAVHRGRITATIGDHFHEINAGQVALINFGQVHSGRVVGAEFVSAGLSPLLVSQLVSEIGLSCPGTEMAFRSSVAVDSGIVAITRSVVSELASERLGQGAMLDAIMRQLVVHLLRSHLAVRRSATIELSRAGPVDRRLRRAIEFMHDNYSRELALEEIAAAAYLSEYHFARLFKQITGVTPHVYLANFRLDRARKLLTDTTLPVAEIAAMVGYQSQSHFTKIFKSIAGVTPRAYRENSLGE